MIKNIRGSITPALLIITGAFLVVIYGILSVLALQFDFSNRQVGSEQALHIAEAGVNYYRWHLAHDPEDYTNGTGQPGPYEIEYSDPQGNAIGRYSLEITPPNAGSSMVTIRSTGWTYQFPNVRRSVVVQYGRQSFAQYAFLQNSSSWYASGITVNGRIHSNNGIRMDGTNLSLVTSAVNTYTCGTETGCSPAATRNGVWGAGGDSGLWQYAVPPVDFSAISFDLAQLRTTSQTEGLYLGPSGAQGYHITFANNGTFTVRRVNATSYIRGYDSEDGCQNRYQVIQSSTVLGTYSISTDPIIFVQDNLWIEGTVRGRVTIATASFPIGSSNVRTWIRNNLVYTAYDGSDVLGVISQNDIYFVRDLPNNFQIDAVLMSQSGSVIRHGYLSGCGSSSNSVRNSFTLNGALITNTKSYWNWNTPVQSGFTTRSINYDTNILYAPPPYFPSSGEYEFISWRED